MRVQVLDLDGSLLEQESLRSAGALALYPLQKWGPRIRLACSFRRFRRFEQELSDLLNGKSENEPVVTFYGSGDLHHVTLALLGRIQQPFNLLVLDNHPDWMRAVPLLHCGTWLYHAAQLPNVRKVFHVGGDVDFDNYYRWMAPWDLIEGGKIVVIPAVRTYCRGRWRGVAQRTIRPNPAVPCDEWRIGEILKSHETELSRRPLYISLDKDALMQSHALVNWDSGHLTLREVETILRRFIGASDGNLLGMDVLGDWSPVRTHGLLRWFLHTTEHPALRIEATQATRANNCTNGAILAAVMAAVGRGHPLGVATAG